MAKEALGFPKFFSMFVPPILIYYIIAALLCISATRTFRPALLPLALLLAYRAAVGLDLSFGNDRLVYLNKGMVVCPCSSAQCYL